MKYDYNTLLDFCKEHNVTLCEDYSNIILKRETLIKGICETENCDNPFTKGFRALLNPNGYCMSCAKNFGKEKAKQTNMEKYGVEHSTQSKEVKDKIKASVFKNYGVEHISHCKEIKDKTKKTCLAKYGVEAPSQSKEIKDKIKKTCLKKYGSENYLQTDDFKEKSKMTCLEKYGVEYSSQSTEIMEKCSKNAYKSKDYNFLFDKTNGNFARSIFLML